MNVYDFDNTIYDGESALDFILAYVKVKPSLVKLLPKILRAFALYSKGKVSIEDALRDYAPLVKEYYCGYDKWQEFAERFWDKRMKKIKPFYSKMQKDDDLILTASPELTIKEICKRLGIKNYICTQVDNKTGDVVRLCLRQNKVKYFKEVYGEDAQIENFYTDSIENDGFFADLANHVFIVDKNKITQIK